MQERNIQNFDFVCSFDRRISSNWGQLSGNDEWRINLFLNEESPNSKSAGSDATCWPIRPVCNFLETPNRSKLASGLVRDGTELCYFWIHEIASTVRFCRFICFFIFCLSDLDIHTYENSTFTHLLYVFCDYTIWSYSQQQHRKFINNMESKCQVGYMISIFSRWNFLADV